MNVTLYSAADQLMALLDQVDIETGELPPEFGNVREIVAQKAEATAAYVLNTEAQTAMVRAAARKLEDKAEAMDRRAQKLREYLSFHLGRTGISEIRASDGTFKVQLQRERDSHVEIYEPAMIPVSYLRVPIPPPPVPDKKRIAAALKDGEDIPGAKIIRTDRLVIS